MNPATDDTLRITKLGENSVRCIYTEKSDGDTTIDTMIMNYQQLLAYLYRIFFLLGLDDDPFQSVQFFIPGYPTVLIQVAMLKQYLPQMIEIMYSTCWSWPAIGREVPAPTT